MLAPCKKSYDKPRQHIKKQRHCSVTSLHSQGMFFPVVTCVCESRTVKKAAHQRTDAFELWCRKRLLRVPWTARRANQSILKEISPEYSLRGLMPKLKLQNLGHLTRRADSLEKTLMLGKIEGRRGRKRMRWLDSVRLNGHEFEQTPGNTEGQGSQAMLQSMGFQSWTRLS